MPSALAATSLAPEHTWPVTTITGGAPTVGASGRGRMILGWLEDAGLLLLLVLMFPLFILAVGAPVALFVRLLLEIARRW